MLSSYADHLERLRTEGRRRTLIARKGMDFSSNDYLAMAGDRQLRGLVLEALERGVPIGSGGSRLLRGNHPEHEELEEFAARFYGCEATLFFPCGYAANSALLATLPQRADHIFFDELIHASAHEGMRLARCGSTIVPHSDPGALDVAISRWRKSGGAGRPWILIESLYSMDGDLAPLDEIAAVAQERDAFVMIDEAHSTGVFGHEGRGLADRLAGLENVIVLRTLGKALGVEGALICCARTMRDFMINRARPFIFSTAPSPLIAAAAKASIALVAKADEPRLRLRELCSYASTRLERHGATPGGTQILPLVIGDDNRTMEIAARLQREGFDVRGVRPPTVPQGTSRLRISLTLNVANENVDALDEALGRALA
jgi:8-amino-7-oxononanoate synthase